MKYFLGLAAALITFSVTAAAPQDTPAGVQRFRELYKELVETNTQLSNGNCTQAAERMAARLKAAGLPKSDLHLIVPPGHEKEGGLVAIYPGRDPKQKAILLLAHIDVVEAKREDWTRDPFTLVEENGSFYARGAMDDKAEAAIWTDLLIRYHTENYRPRRTLKVALTCGEEGAPFNLAKWLTENQRELIDAGFALNEGAWGELDAHGNRVSHNVEAGEKFPQNYRLEVTNPGGHSSRPVRDNAIYRLSAALLKIGAYEFPFEFNDANRAYFTGMARIKAGKGETDVANAMTAFLKDAADVQALALVANKDPSWNATLRTTCVATMLDAGHATNALPQRARANVNCRIFPGTSTATVRAKLEELVADPQVKVTTLEARGPTSKSPPLTPAILAPIEKLTEEFWPGVPVLPILQAGGTDGEFTNAVGIPTYGVEPVFVGPDLGHIHGLNEYVGVQSLLEGREFLYRLVKVYADRK
ncbi:MAG TPA: M20/M25/M40 family metallo-hydrolase [Steroidobacteraceae bacterium]|nr:M20/M25/M40 family metallo-hydrolase [Steroidobacteraceae bacterium]